MKKEEIPITVIVTVYNAQRFLPSCLRSLLEQDMGQFMLYVVDDGSTDGSLALCREILQNRPNTQFFSLQHGGVAACRNYGLQRVNTEYVLFLDGDDALGTGTLRLLTDALKNNPFDLVIFGLSHEMPNATIVQVAPHSTATYYTKEEILAHFTQLWESDLMYSACNKLFRTEKIRHLQLWFESKDFGEDFAFCRCYLESCQKIYLTNQCFYRYTCHTNGSLSTCYRANLFEIRKQENQELTQYFTRMGCLSAQAEEFLARRHIERVVGCVENECSGDNPNALRQKYARLRKMLYDEDTEYCAEKAQIASGRMRLLVFPIQHHWVSATLFLGIGMAFFRNHYPQLFTKLKQKSLKKEREYRGGL